MEKEISRERKVLYGTDEAFEEKVNSEGNKNMRAKPGEEKKEK